MDEHVVLRARKYRNLTQAELADIVGTDRARISKIESGNANPSVAQLAKIADAMDMTLQIKFIPKETEGRDHLEF
ncbi:MAG: helix-turn-helix transcriptional regulator [Lachnospiraceae bacterium]